MPIVTLSKSIRRAALGACSGVATCGTPATMAWGPRWIRAEEPRLAERGLREFMNLLGGSTDPILCPDAQVGLAVATGSASMAQRNGTRL